MSSLVKQSAPGKAGVEGVAGWLLHLLHGTWKRRLLGRERMERELELVETLALGGRKQLLLVVCGGKRFLVGTGADSVQTIVQVSDQTTALERTSC